MRLEAVIRLVYLQAVETLSLPPHLSPPHRMIAWRLGSKAKEVPDTVSCIKAQFLHVRVT